MNMKVTMRTIEVKIPRTQTGDASLEEIFEEVLEMLLHRASAGVYTLELAPGITHTVRVY